MERALPESVESARRDIRQVQRSRTQPANGSGTRQELAEDGQLLTLRVARLRREAGDEQGIDQGRFPGDVDAEAIEPGSLPALRGEEFIADGHVHDADLNTSLDLERDRHAEQRQSMDE